jgi:nitrate/nitrite transport system ATP-binding protein
MNAYLKLDRIDKSFKRGGTTSDVLRDVNLDIAKGEFVSIIGHSGCGKSTLLNIVAGLADTTKGAVFLDGQAVEEPGPDRAVVFQNHSLLPWLTVYDNVALAVDKVFGGAKSEGRTPANGRCTTRPGPYGPCQGQAPGRDLRRDEAACRHRAALAMEPKLLLIDEPFGALDALTRAHLQDSVMQIHASLGNTVIMITHDVDEAVLLSDRIVMMTNGPAATIGEVLDVDLARPRKRLDLVANQTYLSARAAVLEFLYARHKAPSIAA